MTNKVTTQKTIKLLKKDLLFTYQDAICPNPETKGGLEVRKTSEYKLPIKTVSILSIFIDSKLVYDSSIFSEPLPRSYYLGSGGEFIHKRRIIHKQTVAQTLLIRGYKGKQITILVEEEI